MKRRTGKIVSWAKRISGSVIESIQKRRRRFQEENFEVERIVNSKKFGKELILSNEVIWDESVDQMIKTVIKHGRKPFEKQDAALRELANWVLKTKLEPIAKNRDSGEFRYFFIDHNRNLGFSNSKRRTVLLYAAFFVDLKPELLLKPY